MTPAERLAQRLEGDAYSLPSTWKVGDSPEWDHVNSCTEAAALIREQDAKIKRMAEALRVCDLALSKVSDGSTSNEFRRVYADALRDAGVEP